MFVNVCDCLLGENEFICNDGLFKVSPQTAIQQGRCSFTERGRRRVSSLKTVTGSRGRARWKEGGVKKNKKIVQRRKKKKD